ncbi:MAG: chromosome segregation protein SMC [Candidatus Methylomirabilales bacterium]
MYLSDLTLFGFKSFIDRLTVDFQSGITALVGPNGCGKSNIVDAIRWVLGEQSPKALRGDRMEDLIFGGNSHRKPVGMAEVSFTLSNINGQLAVPYGELTITRRLYRSGESEYLLNQVPCRLKDITGLFLDTGLGREPYSIIEQGAIGSLLASKPADRRALLEEAAGVMSYKVRRKTALSRLEAADQNLLRVNDVLREIEQQRNSLHRQAKKAERYQRAATRLKEVQILLLLQEDRRLEQDLNVVIHQEKELAEAQEGCHLRVSKEETSLEAGRLRDLDLEKQLATGQERLYTLRAQRQRDEAEVRSRKELLHDLRQRGEDRQEELAVVTERLDRIAQDLEADAKMRALAEGELEGVAQQTRNLTDALSNREREIVQSEEALATHKREVLALTDRLVSQRNHLTSFTERHRLLCQERETLGRQLAACREETDTVRVQEHELATQLGEIERRIGDLTGERAALFDELTSLQLQQEALTERRAAFRGELSALESRLHSLQELEASLAGLSEGQQFLLKGKTEGVAVCRAIEGPLSKFIRVEAAWEKAVEALLGDLQQGLLTPTGSDALSLLQYLEQEGTGWATLLPCQTEWRNEEDEGALRFQDAVQKAIAALDPESAQRVFGPVLQFVEAPVAVQPLLQVLLGDAWVVQDLTTAVALLRKSARRLRVATPSGVVVSSRGPVHGGKTTAFSLLSRQRELEELPAVIARMTEQLHTVEGEGEAVQDSLSRCRHACSVQEQTVKESEESRRGVERSLAEAHTVASRLGSQTEFLTSELSGVEQELDDTLRAIDGVQKDLEILGQQEETLKADSADRDRKVTLLREQQQELQREVAESRIRSMSLQERRDALARSIERLEADLSREQQREAEIRHEEEEARSREARLMQEIGTLQDSFEVLHQQEVQDVHAVQVLQEERDRLRQALAAQEETLKGARRELTDLQQQQASMATRQVALSTERSLLQKRLQEEGWDRGEVHDLPQGEEPSQDLETLEQEGEALRHKIAAMGPINMAALEEYEALSERYRFLTGQAEDLTASVTSLKATIAEVNQTIKQRFGQTLDSINHHFNRFWQRLFGGGEAELVLSQEEETEEPGVEIRVRIPGKRMTILSLLSGGEKTLGAIALLMALWAVRPSPFVVLDEVDAALDDQNVERFVSLLLELASMSQFILITHHPRTIEIADLLYGITMEEPGVSKLISVRLGQHGEQKISASTS